MKKIFLWILGIFILLFGLLSFIHFTVEPQKINKIINNFTQIKYDEDPKNILEKEAKKQIGKVLTYDFSQGYYKGGRPKDLTTGVCTDVVGDALKNLNYDLKNKVFNDIKRNPKLYQDTPDININFRRAKNLNVYFKRFEKTLTISLEKKDLKEWKGGDLVIWKDHIAVVSSVKRGDGLPYVISNHGRGVQLADILEDWPTELTGHYRVKRSKN